MDTTQVIIGWKIPRVNIQWKNVRNPDICNPILCNVLASGNCGNNAKAAIFKQMSRIKFMSTSCEIFLKLMLRSTFQDTRKWILVQAMASYRQATNQLPLSSYVVTRPQLNWRMRRVERCFFLQKKGKLTVTSWHHMAT